MKINQLFTKTVELGVAERLVRCIGLDGIDDGRTFTRFDLQRVDAVAKFAAIECELREYYLPCKARLYMEDMTDKKVLTVVKQVLRLHGYALQSREKNSGSKKIIVYRIVNNSHDTSGAMHKQTCPVNVDFD